MCVRVGLYVCFCQIRSDQESESKISPVPGNGCLSKQKKKEKKRSSSSSRRRRRRGDNEEKKKNLSSLNNIYYIYKQRPGDNSIVIEPMRWRVKGDRKKGTLFLFF